MIIHVVRFFSPHIGGNENQAYRLLQELRTSSPYTYEVVTYRYSSKLPKRELLNNICVNRVGRFCNIVNRLRSIDNRYCRILSGLLEEIDVVLSTYLYLSKHKDNTELIHVHQATTVALAAYLIYSRYRIPYLIKDATTDGLSYWNMWPFGHIIQKKLVSTAYWVAMTQMIHLKLTERGVSEDRLFNVPNGISQDKCLVKGNYQENRRILFIGNFDQGQIKGLDILIKAFILLYKKDQRVTIWIVGRGDKDDMLNLMKEEGIPPTAYLFIGENKSLIDLYQQCNVFVLSSRAEGFSNSLLEAIAYGMPCVTTAVSSGKDLIVDGYNGRVVPVGDSQNLANAIEFCFENPILVREWGARSKERVRTYYTFNIVSDKYLDVYQRIMK